MKTDKEFKSIIPPLTDEELSMLESSLLAEGCRDALVVWGDILLDGHNRLEICRKHGIEYRVVKLSLPSREAAKEWIIINQFARRNLTTFSRAELALRLKPIFAAKAKERQKKAGGAVIQKSGEAPIRTDKELATVAGVSHDTIAKAEYVRDHASEAVKADLRKHGGKSLNSAVKDLKEKRQRSTREAKRQEAAAGVTINERIIVGDFRKHADRVADGSVSLIFTDPPYDRKASKMLPALAEFAAAKLADGGSLLCYVGQTQLPTALDAFREHLRYWWTVACIHSGGSTVMREYGINAAWKAVLWFVKGTRDNNSIMVSDVMSGGREKSHHDWQQAQSEAAYWIEKLTAKDGLVCDPFIGGGTTAAAAKSLGRQWIGFEISDDVARIASERVQ